MPRGRFSQHPVRVVDGQRVKWCPRCQRDRNIDAGEFSARSSPSTGNPVWVAICKECDAADHRAYIAAQGPEYRAREAQRQRRRRRRQASSSGSLQHPP